MLTIGYRSLLYFQHWQERATLFARIMPSTQALEAAIVAGFTPSRLIALRPPISLELERSLWRQWQISLVVTKASGEAGGETVKQQVAAELKIPLVVIARPAIIYPQQTSDEAEAIAFCRRYLA
jgi:precorrin-6A/cobalt-precorrin-6A reductase